MELNAVPVQKVKAENLLAQNSQPVWKDVKNKFNQAGNILAKGSLNTKVSKDFVAQNIKGLDSFMQPVAMPVIAPVPIMQQNLLASNSVPVAKSVNKKFNQANNMVKKTTDKVSSTVNRIQAKAIKGLEKYYGLGTLVPFGGFLYVPLMQLSTEELAKLNLTAPLKSKLSGANALSNLSGESFKDLPHVVIVNGFPVLPIEIISQPELVRIGVWDAVKDEAKRVQKGIHKFYDKLAKDIKLQNLQQVTYDTRLIF